MQRIEWTRRPEDERTTSPALSLGIPPVGDHCGEGQSVTVGWAIHFTLSGNQRAIGKPTTSRRTLPQTPGGGGASSPRSWGCQWTRTAGETVYYCQRYVPQSPAVYSSRSAYLTLSQQSTVSTVGSLVRNLNWEHDFIILSLDTRLLRLSVYWHV